MKDSRFSRRTLLGATGTAVVTGLAGCSSILPGENGDENGTDTPSGSDDDFNFPDGFSDTGIEVSTVFAEDGDMASLSSVQAEVVRSVDSDQGTQGSTQLGRYDAENKQFVAEVTSAQQGQEVVQNYYFDEGELFIERNYPEQEAQYQKDSYEFTVMRDYNLEALSQHLSNVNLNYQGTEQRNGETVAVYTASTEDFSSDSLFGGELLSQENFESLESAELELTVDSQGYIHTADFIVEYANANGGTTTIETAFTYSEFNNVSVSEPEWVAENSFEDLTVEPTVDVSFDETEGESVTVTVNNIENADLVHIVVNNSLIDQLEEPGSVTVQATDYTVEGSAVPIAIYANRGQQQPTQVDSYTPSAPASGTDTSGNTTDNSTGS